MRNIYLAIVCFVGSFLLFTACASSPQFSLGEPEVVTTGYQFTEGPYWLDDGSLIFSDIPANKVYQWRPGSSESSVFIDSSGSSNGIDAMPDGTIILAQHTGRISRVLESKKLEPIVTEYQGKRLNSPNDLAIRSDSTIYFTDPTFGVSEEEQELSFAGVYRIDNQGKLTLMYDGFSLPNGIAFSPDESKLYVNDSKTGQIIRFDVRDNGDLENRQEFVNVGASTDSGAADGMITDSDGRLYTTSPHGLMVFNPNGEKVGQLNFGQQITNLEWGGEQGNMLFVTSLGEIFRVEVTK